MIWNLLLLLPLIGVSLLSCGLCSAEERNLSDPGQNAPGSRRLPGSGDEFPVPPHQPGPPGVGTHSSGSLEAEPEGGVVHENAYVNQYFGLTYPLPKGWREDFKGPLPSEAGYYVLGAFRPDGTLTGTFLIAAQDEFFGGRLADAMDLLKEQRRGLSVPFTINKEPYEFRAGDHTFARFDYSSMGLWHVSMATEIRCHVVIFQIVTRDQHVKEELLQSMAGVSFASESAKGGGKFPVCIAGYAAGTNVIHKVEPVEQGPRFVSIPLRIMIDTQGKVTHIHVIHAFPEQASSVERAVSEWTVKPYLIDERPAVAETGLLFESGSKHKRGRLRTH